MKKITFISMIATLTFTPSLIFAAWWNPLSWFSPPKKAYQEGGAKITSQVVSTSSAAVTPSNLSEENEKLRKEIAELKGATKREGQAVSPAKKNAEVEKKVLTKTCLNGSAVPIASDCVKNCPDGEIVLEHLNCRQVVMNTEEAKIIEAGAESARKKVILDSMMNEYTQKVAELDQKVVDLKTDYYKKKSDIEHGGGVSMSTLTARVANLLNTTNTEIEKINLQKEQLRLDYLKKLQTLQVSQ